MQKKLLTVLSLLAFITVFSQSGIGTYTPEGALDITSPNNDWGLVLPHVDQAENTKNPTGKIVKKGTIVYDLKENCIRYFNGNEWSGCILAPISIPFELECRSAVVNKEIIANSPVFTPTTVSIPYSNTGEVFDYNEIVMLSKNVTGLKAVLSSGTIQKDAGHLVFSISGTPSTKGEAKFSLSIAGIDCEFVIGVKNLTCDLKNQLNYLTLVGKHIINGKEVTVDYRGANMAPYPELAHCGVTTVDHSFNLGKDNLPSILMISFSRPVTNVGIAFTAADSGEEFTFTINDDQPIGLSDNGGSCLYNITGNKITFDKSNVGGDIIVGGKWFTELTIQHNGMKNGAMFGFCLNNSDVQ